MMLLMNAHGTGQGTTYRKQSVPVAGGEMTVGVWGDDGSLVVLVHGITASHMTWALVGPELSRDYRVVGVDLRGRGGSRELPPPYGIAAHAVDVAAVVEAYGGGPAILLGHSMGAWVAVETARQYPLLVERLVLVDVGIPGRRCPRPPASMRRPGMPTSTRLSPRQLVQRTRACR